MAMQESTFLVEMRGVEADIFTTPAFDVGGIRDMCEKRYVHDGSDIGHIFVGLDPAAGGAKSDYAIVSAFYTASDQLVICGAEAGTYKENTQCASLLINHIMGVRRNLPGAQNARVVFIPESNLGFEALWASDEIRRSGLRDVCVMREDANRAGVKTNRELKITMATAFNMKVVRRNAFVLDHFVCIGEGRTPDQILDEFLMQLKHYSRIVKPPRDPRAGQPTVSYSGKSGYGHDDLAIAVQLLNVLTPVFWTDKAAYASWH